MPRRLSEALAPGGSTDTEPVFELSFRERNPTDGSAVAAPKKSVDFWAMADAI